GARRPRGRIRQRGPCGKPRPLGPLARVVFARDMLGYPPALGGHEPFLPRPRADLTGPLPVGLSAPRGPLPNGRFRPPRRGNVAAGHLAQLTGVSPAQIDLI